MRFKVFVIAAILLIGSVGAFIDDVTGPSSIVPAWHYVSDVACTAGAVGLFFRIKLAYIVSWFYSLALAFSASTGIIWVPIFTLIAANVQAGSPIDGTLLEYGLAFVWFVLLVLAAWRYLWVYKTMRFIGERFESPLLGCVMAGAVLMVAWSIVNALDPSLLSGYLSDSQVAPWIRLMLLSFIFIAVFAYAMWSYATLRSRSVRDAFDLP